MTGRMTGLKVITRKTSRGRNGRNDNSTTATTYKCNACQEPCIDNPKEHDELSISCDICNLWYHIVCTSITPQLWNALVKNDHHNFSYSCDECIDNKRTTSTDLTEIKELMEEHQRQNSRMIQSLETKLLAKVDEVIDEKLKQHNEKRDKKQSDLEKMMKELKETEINMDKNIETQVRNYLDDKEEKNMKMNNIIIHKLPETQDNEIDQAKKDKADIIKIFETTNPEFKAELENLLKEENSIKRLGNKRAEAARPRPVKVILPDVEMKKKIFKGCRNLKKSPFRNVSIQDDLTKQEQEKNFQLRKQLKERKDNGEKVCIYRGQIIPEENHPAYKRD